MIFWILVGISFLVTLFIMRKSFLSWRYDKGWIIATILFSLFVSMLVIYAILTVISLGINSTDSTRSTVDKPLASVDNSNLNGREFYLAATEDESINGLGESLYGYAVINDDTSISAQTIRFPRIFEDEEEKPYVTYITELTTHRDMSWFLPFYPYSRNESNYIIDYEFHIPLKGVQYTSSTGAN